MKNIRYILSSTLIILTGLILSGWGYRAHRIINERSEYSIPSEMSFLGPNWSGIVTNYASEADYRKDSDPNEAPKHYIDLDAYAGFLQNGKIPQTFDSVIASYGYYFVMNHGILPWAIMATVDSLKSAFQRRDWQRTALLAADLGHYIGDAHIPLHLTLNYDGQYTGNDGIHSRYETRMINRYEQELVYPANPAVYIGDMKGFIFTCIYNNFSYVDTILVADNQAKVISGGSTSSDEYYQALWDRTGNVTKTMLQHASFALASLIYTAWVQAGSPVFYPTAIQDSPDISKPSELENFPNPFGRYTTITFEVRQNDTPVTLEIYNSKGGLEETVTNRHFAAGTAVMNWDAGNRESGIYFCVLRSGAFSVSRKMVMVP